MPLQNLLIMKKNKKKIFIVSNSTFQLIHYDKFKVKDLLKFYDVYIIDLTKYYKSQPKNQKIKNFKKYFNFDNRKKLINLINTQKPDLIIDILGQNFLLKTWLIRNFFYKTNQNTLVLSRALQPKIRFNFSSLIKIYFENPFFFIKSVLNFLSKKIFKIIFRQVIPKYYVSSGLMSDGPRYEKKKYFLYSYDYENYLINKNKKKIIKKNYALFVDENIIFHPDYYNSNYPNPPATKKKYYKSLKNFFVRFEKQNNLKVVIGLHPTTSRKVLHHFNQFKKYYNLTGRLIKDSNLVFIHSSTTKHIAAAYNKPLIFLTSNEINKSWFKTYIDQNSKLFNAKIINIDNYNKKIYNYTINKKKYADFINNYVVHPKYKFNSDNYLKIIANILKNE